MSRYTSQPRQYPNAALRKAAASASPVADEEQRRQARDGAEQADEAKPRPTAWANCGGRASSSSAGGASRGRTKRRNSQRTARPAARGRRPDPNTTACSASSQALPVSRVDGEHDRRDGGREARTTRVDVAWRKAPDGRPAHGRAGARRGARDEVRAESARQGIRHRQVAIRHRSTARRLVSTCRCIGPRVGDPCPQVSRASGCWDGRLMGSPRRAPPRRRRARAPR